MLLSGKVVLQSESEKEGERDTSYYLFFWLLLQVPSANMLLLQLVGQSQDLDVGC